MASVAPVPDMAEARPAILAGGAQFGPYLVLGLIAKGRMGQVYLAHDTRLNRSVALKVLRPGITPDANRLARFAQEARTTALLNHPNIVALLDVGSHEGAPFVVSELLEGETLRARLKGGPLSATVAATYALEVARGLAAAHELGVVHRGLKPENLFITDDDRVKILDFGLAKCRVEMIGPSTALGTGHPDSWISTRRGVLMGTAGYMSPEQVRGWPSDHRSDIFSLGVILYEMVTGAVPLHGDSAVMSVPPELERVIRHCLEKNPEMRFQSARDLILSLECSFSLDSSFYSTRRSRRPAAPSGPWKRGLTALLRLI